MLLLGAAAAPVTLEAVPDEVADRFVARGIGASKLAEAEPLGHPYALMSGRDAVAVLVSGRGLDGPEHHTCFVALVAPTGAVVMTPTVGHAPWASRSCSGFEALGLLPAPAGSVRLGVLYHASDGGAAIPYVLSWRLGQQPAYDRAATRACVARRASTIAAMRQPDCGRLTPIDRAFPPG